MGGMTELAGVARSLVSRRRGVICPLPVPASGGHLLPEYQHVAVGDLICDGPHYASYFGIQRADPQHALVYRSIRHPRRGSPIDITDPASPPRVEQQLREAGTYVDFTWALVLNELPGHRTRLLVRTPGQLRAARPPAPVTAAGVV
jgi:hypothetical protein